jgi:hypothetical protein
LNALLEIDQARRGEDWVSVRIHESRNNHTTSTIDCLQLRRTLGLTANFILRANRNDLAFLTEHCGPTYDSEV